MSVSVTIRLISMKWVEPILSLLRRQRNELVPPGTVCLVECIAHPDGAGLGEG